MTPQSTNMRLDVHQSGKVVLWIDEVAFDVVPSPVNQADAQDLYMFTNMPPREDLAKRFPNADTLEKPSVDVPGQARRMGAIDVRATTALDVVSLLGGNPPHAA